MNIKYVKSDTNEERSTWDEYFKKIVIEASKRSTCDRAKVGCLLVNKENRIVSTGYNGSTKGSPHCSDVGHAMRDNHCIATVHAEMNALLYCAKEGISTKDTKAYITHAPCLNCTKSLIQAGITEIYYIYDYRVDPYALKLMKDANISFEKI